MPSRTPRRRRTQGAEDRDVQRILWRHRHHLRWCRLTLRNERGIMGVVRLERVLQELGLREVECSILREELKKLAALNQELAAKVAAQEETHASSTTGDPATDRSEERRVGKERGSGRTRWSQ